MSDPQTLLFVAAVCFFIGTKLDSYALCGIAVGMMFWSGVLYSL